MADIEKLEDAWHGHSGLEVETFLKRQIASAMALTGGKVGYVDFYNMQMRFWAEEGDATPMFVIGLGGTVYNISVDIDLGLSFYVLADEKEKKITITPSTQASQFGSETSEPFVEDYTYVVAINNGNGYVNRISGAIRPGASATFDIRPYVRTGDNYVRIAVTGTTSGQTKTSVCTATVTTLAMSCDHAWQNVWTEGQDYVITGIKFVGSVEKTLHVAVNGTECTPVDYSSAQSYTSTSTTYTIPASMFPSAGIGTVTLWMTAQGASTRVIPFNIMCAGKDDTTPMVVINSVAETAVNFTSGNLFAYAVHNADTINIDMTATVGGLPFAVTPEGGETLSGRTNGVKYPFAYSLEVNTGTTEEKAGVLDIAVKAIQGSVEGTPVLVSTAFDNTYSYIATEGALFYLNAATRNNSAANRETIVNEMGASEDGRFPATYSATWSGFVWKDDAWGYDINGFRALAVMAGTSISIPDFAPLQYLTSYPGMTLEMMIQSSYPSDYDTPVLKLYSGGETPLGLVIYPTRVVLYGRSERDSASQGVNISENRMTHITITIIKDYGGNSGKNLATIYINGIPNVNFAFDGNTSFGNGGLIMGQDNTDFYLYKMRFYGRALGDYDVFNNFMNSIINGVEFDRRETFVENDILDGGVIDYRRVKEAGFNTMVIEMESDSQDIPSFANQTSYSNCNMIFEYGEHPEWNVAVKGVDLDGQGTTSKQYLRWNLRGKTKSGTVWEYGDGTSETGKEGYFAGHDYVRVDRITAKKNVASSMQGHKMGLTALYDSLFKELGLNAGLPEDDYMVAVYQFPFVGFRHYTGDVDYYEFIGLYTAGPDKGSKVTFGYGGDYPQLLSLEGPNHAPRGTRFLHPWVDVDYDYANETLTFGGEEAWDCDAVGGGLKTDESGSKAAILALYNSEWRPAYELVYNCSPYIVSLSETGYASIDAINADIINFNKGKTNGISNQLISIYDSSYELYFYRRKASFVKLVDVDSTREHNVVTYLRSNGYLSTSTPTTAQIVAARISRFRAEAPNYWDMDQLMYHYCFCILTGAKDNFAKNSYPFKFRALSSTDRGNRWGWRQDDLDSAFDTDNNGQNTVRYSVDHGDTNRDGNDLFQGGNSALWMIVRDYYQTEVATMMGQIAAAAGRIATRLKIQGNGLHASLFNVVSYYCWEKSSKYFSATMYDDDRRWTYIEPWLIAGQINPATGEAFPEVYNNVPPLKQALGDQYQGERLWVERRIAYIFSKFRVGAFTGDNAGYSAISFTLAEPFVFHITPAIDLYPVISLANSGDVQGAKTTAGTSVELQMTSDGQTTNYIHGGDWLASLGDLSGMRLTTRAGDSDIAFAVTCNRIQDLIVGNETASNVRFNANSLVVRSPSIKIVDARNTTTVGNNVNLMNCPRLRKALFGGSGATGLLLPVGSRLNEVSFPASASTVFMHTLPYLASENLTLPTLTNIISLYVKDCPSVDPLDLMKDIITTENNQLEYVSISWDGVKTIDRTHVDALLALLEKSGYVSYFDGGVPQNQSGVPYVNGDMDGEISIDSNTYSSIIDNYDVRFGEGMKDRIAISFEDSAVKEIAVANWDTNSDGELTIKEAETITSIGTKFSRNTTITKFNEFKYFKNVSLTSSEFIGCSSLTEITFPDTLESIGNYSFQNTILGNTGNGLDLDLSKIKTLGRYAFSAQSVTMSTSNKQHITLSESIENIPEDCFIVKANSTRYINNLPQSIKTIDSYAFQYCNLPKSISLPNLETLNSGAFANTASVSEILDLGKITEIKTVAFRGCTARKIVLPPSCTDIGTEAFGCRSGYTSGGYCRLLEEINMDNIVTMYGGFMYCSKVKLSVFPKVEHLGGYEIFNNETGKDSGFCDYSFPKIKTLGGINSSSALRGPIRFGEHLNKIYKVSDAGSNYLISTTYITIAATVPPDLQLPSYFYPNYGVYSEDPFTTQPRYLAPIYVPEGSLSAYREATNWSNKESPYTYYRLRETKDVSNVEFISFESKETLPEGYTELQYIESNGSYAFFYPDYTPYYATQVLLDIQLLDSYSAGCLIGVKQSKSEDDYTPTFGITFSKTASNASSLDHRIYYYNSIHGDINAIGEYYPDMTQRTTIKMKNNCVEAYGKRTQSAYPDTGQCIGKITLMGITGLRVSVTGFSGKRRIFRIAFFDPIDGITNYNDNSQYVCVHDYIPCKNSSGVCGLYDRKQGIFVPPYGSSSYIAGPEV